MLTVLGFGSAALRPPTRAASPARPSGSARPSERLRPPAAGGARPRLAARGSLRAAAGFALLVTVPALAQDAPDTWYAEQLISGDTPVHVEHLWSKGPKLRAETVIGGRPIVTLVSGERYTIIDRCSKTGISIQRSPKAVQEDEKRGRPFGNEGSVLQAAGGEKVSTERIAGRECDLYRLTNTEGRREVCVSKDPARLPLQLKFWERSSGQETWTRYLDWSRDLALPDAFFDPGPGVTLEHLTYDDYVSRATRERIGPAPPLFRELLHGTK